MISGQEVEAITDYLTVCEIGDSGMTTGCCTWTAYDDPGLQADERFARGLERQQIDFD